MVNPTDVLKTLLGKQPVVLELDLARGVLEARPQNPLQAMQLLNATTLEALRAVLGEAVKEEKVKGLIVHASPAAPVPIAALDEIGLEIERFAASKPVAVWSESFGELGPALALYKMAAAASQVWLQPTGALSIAGMEAQIVLLKGGLGKLGIQPEFAQRHEYKTAADQFAADEVTDANREMMTSIVTAIVDDAVQTIARRRGLEVADVRAAVDEGPLTAQRAKELGLVDHLGYRDEAYAALLKEWGVTPEHLLFVSRYALKPNLQRAITRRQRSKIGVVQVHGGIVTGRGAPGLGGPNVGSDVVDEHLRHVLRDDDVVAVVLDVDSPGGSVIASDFIRRSVLTVRESGRKVVARMGHYAASGGYYVAMGADEIVALPTTLTGSIGVVAGKMVTQGLYDKLGLVREAIFDGRTAKDLSDAVPMDDEAWERLNAWLDRVYLDFTTFAAHDRGMPVEQLEPLARGRVWTGAQALERGLVDHVGGRRLAFERAAALAGVDLDDVDVVPIGHVGLLGKFSPARSSESVGGVGAPLPGAEALLLSALGRLGLPTTGALSLPYGLRLR